MAKPEASQPDNQPKLVETPPQPPVPSLVQGGYSTVNFTKPYLDRNKDDIAQLGFDLNMKLINGLEEWLPVRIRELWAAIDENNMKLGAIEEGVVSNCSLAALPNVDPLVLVGAEIVNIQINVVEEKGTGESREVTRLKCRIMTALTDDTWRFVRLYFDKSVWLKWGEAQARLAIH